MSAAVAPPNNTYIEGTSKAVSESPLDSKIDFLNQNGQIIKVRTKTLTDILIENNRKTIIINYCCQIYILVFTTSPPTSMLDVVKDTIYDVK